MSAGEVVVLQVALGFGDASETDSLVVWSWDGMGSQLALVATPRSPTQLNRQQFAEYVSTRWLHVLACRRDVR